MQIEVQYSKNYFIFLPQEAEAFGNYIKKEPQKRLPKLKKNMYIIYLQIIFALPAV